jgi:hypothetical protein
MPISPKQWTRRVSWPCASIATGGRPRSPIPVSPWFGISVMHSRVTWIRSHACGRCSGTGSGRGASWESRWRSMAVHSCGDRHRGKGRRQRREGMPPVPQQNLVLVNSPSARRRWRSGGDRPPSGGERQPEDMVPPEQPDEGAGRPPPGRCLRTPALPARAGGHRHEFSSSLPHPLYDPMRGEV